VPFSAPRPLADSDDLSGFSSGVGSLDDWLRQRARPNQLSGASRTFVVFDGAELIGYYALASGAIAVTASPGAFRRNMPDPIPVAVLARLAIVQERQGQGLGRLLFRDAGLRVLQASESIGIRGLLVHAISGEAAEFYRRLGLRPSPVNPLILTVTLKDLSAAVSAT
jgi:GNAT superfamily N-acetyltransferase